MPDYSQLALKAGLEVHQQLDTQTKLFCRCPTVIRADKADVVVKRKLRAPAGEAGEIDVAAAYEQVRGKHFIYHAYNDTTCSVEMDEEPIHELNDEALKACVQVAMLLGAKLVDRLMVMRKTVVDGSNTSGFQRTSLLARNGWLETLSGKVGIATVCIEEESAKIVERGDDCDVYNLSRLGIPLVEIATQPDIKSPEQLKEVAEYIGMVVRSTGKAKRGMGTIRQDINVSIKEGARVEIKGAQELRLLQKLAENEALRQQNLVAIAKELKKRKAAATSTIEDVTSILARSESKLLMKAIGSGGKIKAVNLKGFKGVLGREIQPARRLGTELSDCAKAFAGVAGIIHSDELPKYGINEKEVESIRKKLGCDTGDAFVLAAEDEKKSEKAVKVAVERARQALRGVPSEVRKANPDGTTSFLRPLPGSARMYPETDAVSVKPSASGIEKPKLLAEIAADYQSLGISNDLARTLLKEGVEDLFEEFAEAFPDVNNSFIAEVLVSYAKEMDRRKLDHTLVSDYHIRKTLSALNEGKIAKQSVMEILAEVAAGKEFDTSRHALISDDELGNEIKKIVSENKGRPGGKLIGIAMAKLRGKAEGKKIAEMVKKLSLSKK